MANLKSIIETGHTLEEREEAERRKKEYGEDLRKLINSSYSNSPKKISKTELKPANLGNIFKKLTQEDVAKVDEFVNKLIQAGIPLKVKKPENETELFSHIDPTTKKGSLLHYSYDGSGLYIVRQFGLLFGAGIIEYQRRLLCKKPSFDFLFQYRPLGRVETLAFETAVPLQRSKTNKFVEQNGVYSIRINPADLKGIQRAYEEIKKMDKAINVASKVISDLDSAIGRIYK